MELEWKQFELEPEESLTLSEALFLTLPSPLEFNQLASFMLSQYSHQSYLFLNITSFRAEV